MFFYPKCYLDLIANFHENINLELNFVKISKYEKANQLRKTNDYPLALLGGNIEIHFLHYLSEKEALKKWDRRKQRINFNKMLFAFTDDENCNYDDLLLFENIEFPKVVFTSKKFSGITSSVFLKHLNHQNSVGDIYTNKWHTRRYFNVSKWINNASNNSKNKK